jgi:putative transposase
MGIFSPDVKSSTPPSSFNQLFTYKVIYTTNAIEAMHRQTSKMIKTKGAFTSNQSLLKLVYLSYRDFSKKWTMTMRKWGLAMSQLYIKFGGRF